MTDKNEYREGDWLDTGQIANLFGVTQTTAGNWFRKGNIPQEVAQRRAVPHENGVTILQWVAPWTFLKDFSPPRKGPQGPRKK